MSISLCRVYMKDQTEVWMAYVNHAGKTDVDAVVVKFLSTKTWLFLYTNSEERKKDTEYLYRVCDLVHDLPSDFELIIKPINKEASEIPLNTLIMMSAPPGSCEKGSA